jgi:serine phosphatase RsbU (regulator of sigma subunit)
MFFSSVFASTRKAPRELMHADVPQLRGGELAAAYYGQRMGGDFYDFLRVSPQRVLFGLLDVAGRLEDNQTIVSATRETFRSVGAELLAGEDVNEAEAMVRLCLELNRTVLQTAGGVHPCPAFAGCYNEDLGVICYFNAGHTPGLVRDHKGSTELPATGLPLGLFSHAACDAPMVALEPDAALLLVSRGVVEGRCKGETRRGEEFGLERVKTCLSEIKTVNARELSLSVLNQMQQFICTPPTHNDVTALALVRNGEEPR